MDPRIALVGFMGSGKSSVGSLLAESLGFNFLDTDAWIEKNEGLRIRDLFRLRGEAAFRALEQEALEACLAGDRLVLSTGGGLWMMESSRNRLLSQAWCVWLRVDPEQVWERVRVNIQDRPLLAHSKDPRLTIKDLLEQRNPFYALAHDQMDTSGKKPGEVVRGLRVLLRERSPFDLSSLPL